MVLIQQSLFTATLVACTLTSGWALTLNPARAKLCEDPELNAIVAPPLRDVIDIFGVQNNTLYPTAISAVGALRYGGNTAVVDGKREICDHDVDFLLVGPPGSSWDKKAIDAAYQGAVANMMERGWKFKTVAHVFPTDLLVAPLVSKRFFSDDHPKDLKSREYGLCWMLLASKPNPLTEAFNHSTLLRFAGETLRTWSPDSATSAIKTWENSVKPVFQVADKLEPPAHHIRFDFFYILGPQSEYQPHPKKKVLFHGVDMRYPADSTLPIASLQMAFWDSHSAHRRLAEAGDICAFFSPGSFPDDMSDDIEHKRVAKQCSTALAENGYQSFVSLGC